MLAKWIDFLFFFKSQNLVSAEICTFAKICWNLPEWTEHSKIDRNLIWGGTWGIMVPVYMLVWNILTVMGRINNKTARINNNENKWRKMTTLLFFFFFTSKQLCCLIKYQAFTYLLLSSFTFAPLLSLPPSLQLQGFFHLFSSHLFLLLSFFLSFFLFFFHLFCGFCCTFLWVYLFLYRWVLFGLMERRERGGRIFVHGLCVCAVVGLCELGF